MKVYIKLGIVILFLILFTSTIYAEKIIKEWLADEYAEKYQVEVSTDEDFENVIMNFETKETKFEIELESGTYYIHVRGHKKEFPGPWSEPIEIFIEDIKPDPLLPIVKASLDALDENYYGKTKREISIMISDKKNEDEKAKNKTLLNTSYVVKKNKANRDLRLKEAKEKGLILATSDLPAGWDIMLYKDQYDFNVFSVGLKLKTPIQRWVEQEIDTIRSRIKIHYYVLKNNVDAKKLYLWFFG